MHEPSLSINFLDLNLATENGGIVTHTHQKKLNLNLYLAGNSAHPVGTLKGLIFGELRRYQLTNTHHEDFQHFAVLLYCRLKARGHTPHVLQPLFEEAYRKLYRSTNHQPTTNHQP